MENEKVGACCGVNIELCPRMEISRDRLQVAAAVRAGRRAENDLPRRPHSSPQQTSREMEEP